MKVLFDHQAFTMQSYGGVSRYYSMLIDRFDASGVQFDLPTIYSNNHYAGAMADRHPGKVRVLEVKNRYAWKVLLRYAKRHNRVQSRRLLLKGDFDVFHPTYYDPYFLDCIGDKPFVITVYDMIHEIFPEYFPLEEPVIAWKQELAQRASQIIAISESTKNDIIRFWGVDNGKVTVTHLGNSLEVTGRTTTGADDSPHYKYLLYVGDRSLYKNFYFFAEAVAPLIKADPGLHLVCAGRPFSDREIAFFRYTGIDGRVKQCQAGDARLASLYRGAIAFVCPSLYEGFGIPVLEAFSCNCPVVMSNTSSLPEVGGNAAIYFDPKDVVSIRDAVSRVIDDRELQEEMAARGRDQLAGFSWERCARETVSVYGSLSK